MNRLLRLAAPLLALTLTPALAHAQAVPVVTYGPDLDAVTAAAAAEQAPGTRAFMIAGSLAEQLGGAESETVVFGAETKRCTDPPAGGKPIGGVAVMANEDISEMAYTSAILRLRKAIDGLPCNADGASTENLYDLFFMSGYAHFEEGRVEDARKAFAQAAAIDASRPWNPAFSPAAKTLYLESLQALLDGEPASLRVEVGDLLLDGGTQEQGRTATVQPGGHLVRAGKDLLWVTVAPESERGEGQVVISTAAKVIAGLMEGAAAYGAWLQERADTEGWQGQMVVLTAEQAWVWNGTGFDRRTTALGAKEEPPVTQLPGIILAGAGGALTGVGAALHFGSYGAGVPGADGAAMMPKEDYEALVLQNRLGLGLTVAGAAVAVTGVVLAILPRPKPPAIDDEEAQTALAPRVAPWAVGGPDGFVIGIGGTLP
ncbi:MAG: hypothetical protein GY898_13385 [Proteobacteria bacterium]|nr:hypothetical protein [Pseudomonadota bacterium]